MNRTKTKVLEFALMMLLLAAFTACGSSTATPANLSGTAAALPEGVMTAAQSRLSEALGVEAESIQIEEVEEAEWSDACLELAQPGENCAQVVTPGYLVVLTVEGQTYEIHTNADASIIRLNR
jgi:hypothetical protein